MLGEPHKLLQQPYDRKYLKVDGVKPLKIPDTFGSFSSHKHLIQTRWMDGWMDGSPRQGQDQKENQRVP